MTTTRGRRTKSPHARGVCVRLPSPLVEAIDNYAAENWCIRNAAIKVLLERGLVLEAASKLTRSLIEGPRADVS